MLRVIVLFIGSWIFHLIFLNIATGIAMAVCAAITNDGLPQNGVLLETLRAYSAIFHTREMNLLAIAPMVLINVFILAVQGCVVGFAGKMLNVSSASVLGIAAFQWLLFVSMVSGIPLRTLMFISNGSMISVPIDHLIGPMVISTAILGAAVIAFSIAVPNNLSMRSGNAIAATE